MHERWLVKLRRESLRNSETSENNAAHNKACDRRGGQDCATHAAVCAVHQMCAQRWSSILSACQCCPKASPLAVLSLLRFQSVRRHASHPYA